MIDRELLERAAKAAGLNFGGTFHQDGSYSSSVQTSHKLNIGYARDSQGWNPLTDDGDALRLAVMLGFEIFVNYRASGLHASVCSRLDRKSLDPVYQVTEFHRDHAGDPLAATRRAIVRAAAALADKQDAA